MTDTASQTSPASSISAGTCWCGGSKFEPAAHKSYSICVSCGNAVYNGVVSGSADAPAPDIDEIYSDSYWERHQKSRGAPSLETRSRIDLPARCAYWLKHLLPYVAPPAKILELGSSHGGFLKMLAMAGFDVVGMEISQSVVDESSRRFGVNVLRGILEDHESTLGTFGAVAMMDVVEHLTDPVRTLSTVARVLKPDGVLMVQMPEFKPEYASDWMMFLPGEHTFLHTRASATKLCGAAGLPHVVFERAIYGHHDMYFFASRTPVERRSLEQIETDLLSRPDSRMMLALLDAIANVPPPQAAGVPGGKAALKELRRAFISFSRRKFLGGRE